MLRIILLSVLFSSIIALSVNAQKPVVVKKDSTVSITTDTTIKTKRIDTLKVKYVNEGKIAGKKAMYSSMILPGLGQIRNGVTVYRLIKVAGIYTGGTLLTLSYIDNSKNYKEFLTELKYRQANGDKPDPEGTLSRYPTAGLILQKDNFRRNREVVIFSLVGLYLLNVVEAYIDARLKYWNVDDIAFKISPALLNNNTMYGFNTVSPGLKLTFAF